MDDLEWSDLGRNRTATAMTFVAVTVLAVVVWTLAIYGAGHLMGGW